MELATVENGSNAKGSLIVQKYYVPRLHNQPSPQQRLHSNDSYRDQPSPGGSSLNSQSPNGYMADYNSEVRLISSLVLILNCIVTL